ncbi:MAG: type I methionyl aminopeptidase [Magnetococcales bacterium]|nr:type I methionyl aminopeptidase [Magnetococcales bacterium]
MIHIKNAEEIAAMRATCRLAAQTLAMIEEHVKPGVTTLHLNDICHDYIISHGATPSPLNYRGFPKSICTSINHQICHGIPSERVIREGDIINIDITTYLNGFHGDTSKTFHVGKATPKGEKVRKVALDCLNAGISVALPGVMLKTIGATIERLAKENRCSVVHEYCGHGIGREFHEEPAVLHYEDSRDRIVIRPGMIFTIEPMINLGNSAIKHMKDNWTVVTKDHSLSAQFEHTILITETGNEVLTDLDGKITKA